MQFTERLRIGDTELRLHNNGLLRYRVFFKGNVAALYLVEKIVVALGKGCRREHRLFRESRRDGAHRGNSS